MNWYEEMIEEPIRNLVKLLRDNGFNTTCSCGHYPRPYVQINDCYEEDIGRLYNLLVENDYYNFSISFWWHNIDATKDYKKFVEISFTILDGTKHTGLILEESIRRINDNELS